MFLYWWNFTLYMESIFVISSDVKNSKEWIMETMEMWKGLEVSCGLGSCFWRLHFLNTWLSTMKTSQTKTQNECRCTPHKWDARAGVSDVSKTCPLSHSLTALPWILKIHFVFIAMNFLYQGVMFFVQFVHLFVCSLHDWAKPTKLISMKLGCRVLQGLVRIPFNFRMDLSHRAAPRISFYFAHFAL